jgi:hypothetical protein
MQQRVHQWQSNLRRFKTWCGERMGKFPPWRWLKRKLAEQKQWYGAQYRQQERLSAGSLHDADEIVNEDFVDHVSQQ